MDYRTSQKDRCKSSDRSTSIAHYPLKQIAQSLFSPVSWIGFTNLPLSLQISWERCGTETAP